MELVIENDDWDDDSDVKPSEARARQAAAKEEAATKANELEASELFVVDTKGNDVIKEGKEQARPPTPPNPPTMTPDEFNFDFFKNLFVEAADQKLIFDDIKAKYQVLTGQTFTMAKVRLDLLKRRP